MNDGDLLGCWMAELGSGSLTTFKARAHWLARTSGVDIHVGEPGRWLRDAAALGHIEVDWDRGRWSAAPRVLTCLPAGDGYAVLTGLRHAAFLRQVEQLAADELQVDWIEQPSTAGGLARPSTVFIQYDPQSDIDDIAQALGAEFVTCAAVQLAERLPALRLGPPAAAPAYGNTALQRYAPAERKWVPVARASGAGAYRHDAAGPMEYRWHDGSAWWRTDLATAVFWSLAAEGRSALRWRQDAPGSERTGQLFTDWGAPLPPLHQRCAVLCTGLIPQFASAAQTAIYDNVPLAVATLIARALRQPLERQ